MTGGLYFKQVRKDKDMMLISLYCKMARAGKYDMYHKRSKQAFNRYLRRVGV